MSLPSKWFDKANVSKWATIDSDNDLSNKLGVETSSVSLDRTDSGSKAKLGAVSGSHNKHKVVSGSIGKARADSGFDNKAGVDSGSFDKVGDSGSNSVADSGAVKGDDADSRSNAKARAEESNCSSKADSKVFKSKVESNVSRANSTAKVEKSVKAESNVSRANSTAKVDKSAEAESEDKPSFKAAESKSEAKAEPIKLPSTWITTSSNQLPSKWATAFDDSFKEAANRNNKTKHKKSDNVDHDKVLHELIESETKSLSRSKSKGGKKVRNNVKADKHEESDISDSKPVLESSAKDSFQKQNTDSLKSDTKDSVNKPKQDINKDKSQPFITGKHTGHNNRDTGSLNNKSSYDGQREAFGSGNWEVVDNKRHTRRRSEEKKFQPRDFKPRESTHDFKNNTNTTIKSPKLSNSAINNQNDTNSFIKSPKLSKATISYENDTNTPAKVPKSNTRVNFDEFRSKDAKESTEKFTPEKYKSIPKEPSSFRRLSQSHDSPAIPQRNIERSHNNGNPITPQRNVERSHNDSNLITSPNEKIKEAPVKAVNFDNFRDKPSPARDVQSHSTPRDRQNQGNAWNRNQGNVRDRESQNNSRDRLSQGNAWDRPIQQSPRDKHSQGHAWDRPSHGNSRDGEFQSNSRGPSQGNAWNKQNQSSLRDRPSQGNSKDSRNGQISSRDGGSFAKKSIDGWSKNNGEKLSQDNKEGNHNSKDINHGVDRPKPVKSEIKKAAETTNKVDQKGKSETIKSEYELEEKRKADEIQAFLDSLETKRNWADYDD